LLFLCVCVCVCVKLRLVKYGMKDFLGVEIVLQFCKHICFVTILFICGFVYVNIPDVSKQSFTRFLPQLTCILFCAQHHYFFFESCY